MAITARTIQEQSNDDSNDRPVNDGQLSPSFLEKLPAEIIQAIASYLSAPDLACFGATCPALVDHASNDLLWASLVNERLPTPIKNPYPFESFRRLYFAYHPYWFIPQHKIWFADMEHTGMLIIARYNNCRGVIEAYPVVAERGFPQFQTWISHPEVMIQSFEPRVRLGSDPVLFLSDHNPSSQTASIQSFKSMPEERRMPMASDARHMYTSLSLCSTFKSRESSVKPHVLWPPQTIQSNARTVRDLGGSLPQIPQHLSDLSESFFRVRKWANQELTSPAPNQPSLTYSTLDPVLYTPTTTKPYQGIWVGDYSAHGCEFLLVIQGDDLVVPRGAENESKIIDAQEDISHRGTLLAVKLTGDPNVPRAQKSFVAEDIGARGFIGIGTEEPFVGARIVRCLGHVAGLGFHDDTYIESQLILISHDYMAHYWKEMGHVSYYRRVDMDALLHNYVSYD